MTRPFVDQARNRRPEPKSAGGTHNRKARRAAKAQQPELPTSPPFDEAVWRESYERRRAERNAYWASKTDAELEDRRLAESGALRWDPLFTALMLDAIPLWVHRHYRTDPDERVRRAHDLGEILAFSQGAAEIAEQAANHDSVPARKTRAGGEISRCFNALAEGLAIGAYGPEGVVFLGIRWAVAGSQLRVTNRGFCAVFPLEDEAFWQEAAA